MYTYKILDNNTVEVFKEDKEVPFLRQPNYPNQDSFDTKEEAQEWAKLYIESIEDEEAPYAPIGKDIAGKPKPTKEDVLATLKKQAEQYGDDIPARLSEEIAELEAELSN